MSPKERRLTEGHAMQDTSKVARKPEGGQPGRGPLVDDELADQLLGKLRPRAAELLDPNRLLSQVTGRCWNGRWLRR
jgi:hypothetical protein